jgi:hypothetical protein
LNYRDQLYKSYCIDADNSEDYLFMSTVVDDDDHNEYALRKLVDCGRNRPDVYVMLLYFCNNKEVPYDLVFEDTIKSFPEYSYWYYSRAIDTISNAVDDSYSGGTYIRTYDRDNLELSLSLMKKGNEAPLNSLPEYFPLDIASYEFVSQKSPTNTFVAGSIFNDSSISLNLRDFHYSFLKDAVASGEFSVDYLDDYLLGSYRITLCNNNDIISTSTLTNLRAYISIFQGVIDDNLALTSQQDKEYHQYLDKLAVVNDKCTTMFKHANTHLLNWYDYLSYRKWTRLRFDINTFIHSELSKLDPPTIKDWLAGGATLKPRQGSATAQGSSPSQSSGSQPQKSTAQ